MYNLIGYVPDLWPGQKFFLTECNIRLLFRCHMISPISAVLRVATRDKSSISIGPIFSCEIYRTNLLNVLIMTVWLCVISKLLLRVLMTGHLATEVLGRGSWFHTESHQEGGVHFAWTPNPNCAAYNCRIYWPLARSWLCNYESYLLACLLQMVAQIWCIIQEILDQSSVSINADQTCIIDRNDDHQSSRAIVFNGID